MNRAAIAKVGTVRTHARKGSDAEARTSVRSGSATETISVGSRVITSFGNVGTVEKLDKETAEVLVGGMRLREKLKDLQIVEADTGVSNPQAGKSSFGLSKPTDSPDVPAELNLIGLTTAEAEYELDRFVDEAYMASLPQIRIIHGFGTGALKNFVHHFLKNHDLIERFAFAPPNQGGNGATIGQLKL
jgi:DNA mismatch repair protein MutS2